jgi:transcriptional regulator with XRE-family HTH domain
MSWKELSLTELADSLGVSLYEVREKQRLIDQIVKVRRARRLSQAALAKKLGLSQSRIAQIESGVRTSAISFDVLLGILVALGYEFKVVTKEAA